MYTCQADEPIALNLLTETVSYIHPVYIPVSPLMHATYMKDIQPPAVGEC